MRIRHKFNAIRLEYDGIKFASKKECNRYKQLKQLQTSGEIAFFLRQVPFHLKGNVKYVCDFVVFWSNGSVTIEDVKGVRTPVYITKKKIVEATYPIKITEV
jgi:hypothetical protein